MLSDPVAEAFGLIHRHPSGENFCRVAERNNVLAYQDEQLKIQRGDKGYDNDKNEDDLKSRTKEVSVNNW